MSATESASAGAAQAPAPRRLGSLSAQVAVATAILATALVGAAVWGWWHVRSATSEQIEHLRMRAEAADAVNQLALDLSHLEARIERFVIDAGGDNRSALERALGITAASMERVSHSRWVRSQPLFHELGGELEEELRSLRKGVQELLGLRSEIRRWLPAMAVMQERMVPAQSAFRSALELALQEIDNSGPAARNRLGEPLIRLRLAHQALISEFRLLVANRLGAFASDPLAGMDARASNIAVYEAEILSLLDRIEAAASRGDDTDPVLLESVAAMRRNHEAWWAAYREVRTRLASSGWRQDLVLLETTLDPLLAELRQRLSTLQLELQVRSATDITDLTGIARTLSGYIAIIAALVIGALLLIIATLQRTVFRPMAGIAAALKAEAQDKGGRVPLPRPRSSEARDLIEAFEYMREKVRDRETRLDHLAHHDPLTGLPNRILFRDRLEHAVAQAARSGGRVALLFLDLDRFKQVNDGLGHETGDALLQAVAMRLVHPVRSGDTVARLGGDEFALILEGVSDPQRVATVAAKIVAGFEEPLEVGNHVLYASASIGIALYPDDDTDPDALIRDADTAMYHAKQEGRATFRFYSAEMSRRVEARLDLETALREAVARQDFELHYQPVWKLGDLSVVGAECLLRWNHPTRGPVSPMEFIPVLEESGLIADVTRWVLREACAQFRRCSEAGTPLKHIAVNLSGRMLQDRRVMEGLLDSLAESCMDPGHLVLEITEDTLIHHMEAARRVVGRLRELGIRIALDDFGTGQSSLSHLRVFPFDQVKIDREFVRDIPDDAYDSTLASTIVTMGRALDIEVVAEGVESPAQMEFLAAHGCPLVQGFLLARPMPGDDLLEFLAGDARRMGSGTQ